MKLLPPPKKKKLLVFTKLMACFDWRRHGGHRLFSQNDGNPFAICLAYEIILEKTSFTWSLSAHSFSTASPRIGSKFTF
jgi:hypothetical protein